MNIYIRSSRDPRKMVNDSQVKSHWSIISSQQVV